MDSQHLLRTLVLALALAAPSALAIIVTDLHQVTVPVADQSPDARQKAFRAALGEVVVRVTGDARAPASAALAPLFKAPQRLIAEYAYVAMPTPAPTGGAPAAAAPAVPPATGLAVRFDSMVLEGALREAGSPVFGRERPQTLMWLAFDEGPDRDLVGPDDGDTFAAAAARRGLPLLWPALDPDDRAALTIDDVQRGDEQRLAAASERYRADGALAVLVTRVPGGWQARSLWRWGEAVERWEGRGATLAALADAVSLELAARYAARYAVLPGATSLAIDVEVENVTDPESYATAQRCFGGLSMVRKVDVLGARQDLLRLRVEFLGVPEMLERVVALEPKLGRSHEPATAGALRYRFQP
jgi:hypothetical protein